MEDQLLDDQLCRRTIAVLVPCHNEARTVGAVVAGFAAELPSATIYVYDNNSTDQTAAIARDAGAVVRQVALQGKGHVVRRMFADVDSDVYLLVDGDGTYDPGAARALVLAICDCGNDLANGRRVPRGASFPTGHVLGNTLFRWLVRRLFGRQPGDMLSGYKACSRRLVKSLPILSNGFEIETELMVHALELRVPWVELPVQYRDRPPMSESKLHTYRDGLRILSMLAHLLRHQRPLAFFGGLGAVLLATAVALGVPVVTEFFRTGLVPRFPSAILATGLVILAFLSVTCGVVLESVSLGRREVKILHYLAQPGPLGPGLNSVGQEHQGHGRRE